MRKTNSVSWVRMVLAFAAVLMVAGPGLVLAGGGTSAYAPKSSIIIGPGSVAHSGAASYVLRVTYTDGSVLDNPAGTVFPSPTPGGGTIDSAGSYVAPATGIKDKISASYSNASVTTQASKFITLTP